MTNITLANLGVGGIIKDIPAHELPPEVWSDGQNVRFHDNKVVKFVGHEPVFDPPTVDPYWLMPVITATKPLWLYSSLGKVYAIEDQIHTEITRASGGDYSVNVADLWSGGILGGIPVITNGADDPQVWNPPDGSTLLIDLPNWPASTSCKIMRAFRNYLVAFNITKSGTVSPHMVKWSHAADPGTLPTSWDEGDPTVDAGEVELTDSEAGIIQDARVLRDSMIIYKDNSTHIMRFQGGRFIFNFQGLFQASGILTKNCVATTPDALGHFVATGDDIIIHNGQNAHSVINKRWRRFLNTRIDDDNFNRSFCLTRRNERENWFCFPETGSLWPSLALVWNSVDGSIGLRELSDISFITEGVIDEGSAALTWDTETDAWDDKVGTWGFNVLQAYAQLPMAANPVLGKLFKFGDTNLFNGANMTSFVQRTDLAIAGQDRQGQVIVDNTKRKLVTRMWPNVTGGPVDVRIGAQETQGGAITWAGLQSFNPMTQQYLDFCVSGRYLAVEFKSSTDVAWELESYTLEVELLGAL